MLGTNTTANITQRTTYEPEAYLTQSGIEPEKRLWVAVILTIFDEFEDVIRSYNKKDLALPEVRKEFKYRKDRIIYETQGQWFAEICSHVGISPDHIRNRLKQRGEEAA